MLVATEAEAIDPADAAVVTGMGTSRFARNAVGPHTSGWT
jgi:hypothetical protein